MKTPPMPRNTSAVYEDAVKWIEDEIHKHGVFEVKRATSDSYDYKTGTFSQVPNGRLVGFTVSSQHTKGEDWNILQLVQTMKRQAGQVPNDLSPAKAKKAFKAVLRKLKNA